MKKTLFLSGLIYLTFACAHGDKKITNKIVHGSAISIDSNSVTKLSWYDSLIVGYIENTKNEMIQLERKDSSSQIQWLLDTIENTDTAKYLIFNIGSDVSDSDGMRFVSYSWIYIDTLTRKLYEYDSENGLVEWKK